MSIAPPQRGWRHAPWFTLLALTVTFSVGFIDRQVLNLLVQPIKADFHLSDLSVSLLQGAAFSIAYLVMSPVFGRWVDVAPRKPLLLACIVLWSLFTGLCGLTQGFTMLFLARSGVGAAEAGLTPSSWSLLSDAFDRHKLARALAIYNVGPYIGGGLALFLGGALMGWAQGLKADALGGMAPWQITFLAVSLMAVPAMILVALMAEAPRHRLDPAAIAPPPDLATTFRTLARERRFYACFYVGMALAIIPIYAFPAWLPSVAIRQYHVPIASVGKTYGIVSLVGGTLGVLSGPTVARWIEQAGYRDAHMRLGALSGLGVAACCAALWLRTGYPMVLAIGGIASFFYSLPTPTAATALQIVTPPRMRGVATSLYIVVVTIMGLGIAPVSVAFLTDKVFHDELRVGDSLALVCAFTALAGMLAICGTLKPYRRLSAIKD